MAEGGEKRDPSSHRTPGQIRRQVEGYNARPENVEKRSNNNKARRQYEAEHGDVPSSHDVHHKKPQRSGGTNAPGNLAAIPKSKNRGWRDGV